MNMNDKYTSSVGLAYVIRFVYDNDDSRLLKISIEEYEEHNDNNDCSN